MNEYPSEQEQNPGFGFSMETPERKPQSSISSLSSPPSTLTRLWKPAAQRNLRNQWSILSSARQDWLSAFASGRSHATSLINAFLSRRYMPKMELGTLSSMKDIRRKACQKLFKQQELHGNALLSSYKDMVAVVRKMVIASRSMRCYRKQTSGSPLIQFSSSLEKNDDTGDGGGIPVFKFWSVSSVEILADELIEMFKLELVLKRLLVVGLVSPNHDVLRADELCWSNELYPGELADMSTCNLHSEETSAPSYPRLKGYKSDLSAIQPKKHLERETFQVYLTTWLAEVNIDSHRVNEIFGIMGEEMNVAFS